MNSQAKKLDTIYHEIKDLLESMSDDLLATNHYLTTKSKQADKPNYHLYGKKKVSIFNKEPDHIYFAGVIQQKNYVSLYFSPIYSHREVFDELPPKLKKYHKGKSCFNFTQFDETLKKQAKQLLIHGKRKYQSIAWI